MVVLIPSINLPYNVQNGDPLDADKMMANLETITSAVNGNLGTDNAIIDSPVAQPGAASSAGVSSAFLRSDVLFAIQGFEQVTALPTTGNFLYRRCMVTSGVNAGKGFVCTDPAGTGTFVVVENPASSDLVIHALEHKDGGHDPLADLTITDHMKAARTIYSATQSADVSNISAAAYTTIVDLVLPAGILAQTLDIDVSVMAVNGAVATRKVGLRVQDVTAASATIWRSKPRGIAATGGADQADISGHFRYTLPAAGARTLRLQAGADGATVNIIKSVTFNGDATVPANIEAVVV